MVKFPATRSTEPAPPAIKPPLSPADVRSLRARAHALKPVVRIAAGGPTEGMVQELDRALTAHELVKIHAASDDREERARLLLELCERLNAQPVQTIGKMLVAFRPRPQVDPAPTRHVPKHGRSARSAGSNAGTGRARSGAGAASKASKPTRKAAARGIRSDRGSAKTGLRSRRPNAKRT